MRYICLFIFLSFNNIAISQARTDLFLQNMLSTNHENILQQVLKDPNTYRLQIIYTQINRDKNNRPSFKNYYFHFDPLLYFNPASMVKLPLAALALEKFNKMHIEGVDKYTSIQYDSSYMGQSPEYIDSSSENGLPSIAHFIKKVFLVSDNNAYNRLYEFIGQQTINKNLHDKGYNDIRITRQFRPFNADQNRHSNQVRFIDQNKNNIYTQATTFNTDSFHFPASIKIGKGHYNGNDSLINEPMDFTTHNDVSLEDFQQVLQSVLFPASVAGKQRFMLTDDDRQLLYRYMSQYPSETNYPKYDSNKYYDSYVKFFFKDSTHKIPADIRVFNKVGWSYGFLTDVSYIADFKNKIEFMLSATLYVNSDGILNDDKYDYETIGYPFMHQLGQTLYQYELKRKKNYQPDLSQFKMTYKKQDGSNTRPAIKQIDN
ncbi:MAG: serine hydrolase [Ferruginibacter sp.]